MKTLVLIAVVLAITFGVPISAAEKSSKKQKAEKVEPEFEGQPYMVAHLKRLTKAKAAIQSGKDTEEAKSLLKKVSTGMMKSTDKGNHTVDMRRHAGQALAHFEKGETDKALADIDNAIIAVNKAGQVGQKQP